MLFVNWRFHIQKNEKMENENSENRRTKGYILMRRIMDYGMGIIILGVGIIIAFAPKLNLNINMSDLYRYSISGLFIIYGGWRIYRGYQKNYFR